MNDKHYIMTKQNLITRIVSYVEKSTKPTKTASAYDRLLRSTIFGLAPVTQRTHDHVMGSINSAQHRAECGDMYNCRLIIGSAIKSMSGCDHHDIQYDHGERTFHEV